MTTFTTFVLTISTYFYEQDINAGHSIEWKFKNFPQDFPECNGFSRNFPEFSRFSLIFRIFPLFQVFPECCEPCINQQAFFKKRSPLGKAAFSS